MSVEIINDFEQKEDKSNAVLYSFVTFKGSDFKSDKTCVGSINIMAETAIDLNDGNFTMSPSDSITKTELEALVNAKLSIVSHTMDTITVKCNGTLPGSSNIPMKISWCNVSLVLPTEANLDDKYLSLNGGTMKGTGAISWSNGNKIDQNGLIIMEGSTPSITAYQIQVRNDYASGSNVTTITSNGVIADVVEPIRNGSGSLGQADRYWGALYANNIFMDGQSLSNIFATKGDVSSAVGGVPSYKHDTFSSHGNGLYKITVNSEGHVSNAYAVTASDLTDILGDSIGGGGSDYTHPTYSGVSTSDTGLYKIKINDMGHIESKATVNADDLATILGDRLNSGSGGSYTHPPTLSSEYAKALYSIAVNKEGHITEIEKVTGDDLAEILGSRLGSGTGGTVSMTADEIINAINGATLSKYSLGGVANRWSTIFANTGRYINLNPGVDDDDCYIGSDDEIWLESYIRSMYAHNLYYLEETNNGSIGSNTNPWPTMYVNNIYGDEGITKNIGTLNNMWDKIYVKDIYAPSLANKTISLSAYNGIQNIDTKTNKYTGKNGIFQSKLDSDYIMVNTVVPFNFSVGEGTIGTSSEHWGYGYIDELHANTILLDGANIMDLIGSGSGGSGTSTTLTQTTISNLGFDPNITLRRQSDNNNGNTIAILSAHTSYTDTLGRILFKGENGINITTSSKASEDNSTSENAEDVTVTFSGNGNPAIIFGTNNNSTAWGSTTDPWLVLKSGTNILSSAWFRAGDNMKIETDRMASTIKFSATSNSYQLYSSMQQYSPKDDTVTLVDLVLKENSSTDTGRIRLYPGDNISFLYNLDSSSTPARDEITIKAANTHYSTNIYATRYSTDTSNTSASTNPYIKIIDKDENGNIKTSSSSSIQICGGDNVTITSNNDGSIEINASDTNTHYNAVFKLSVPTSGKVKCIVDDVATNNTSGTTDNFTLGGSSGINITLNSNSNEITISTDNSVAKTTVVSAEPLSLADGTFAIKY